MKKYQEYKRSGVDFMVDSFKIYQQFTNNDEFKKVFLAQLFEKVNFDMKESA